MRTRSRKILVTATLAIALWALAAPAGDVPEKPSVASMPPVVVKTVPQAGDTAVDAATVKEIRVTFSKQMTDKSWSLVTVSEETFPKITGDIRYDNDGKTCICPVQLEPGKTYVTWLNRDNFQGFMDARGQAAVPYLLVFETK